MRGEKNVKERKQIQNGVLSGQPQLHKNLGWFLSDAGNLQRVMAPLRTYPGVRCVESTAESLVASSPTPVF